MNSIYNISNNLRQIIDNLSNGIGIDQETGEIDPEIVNQLAITRENLELKAIDYGFIIKSFDDELEIIDKEIKRLTELKNQKKNTKDRLKEVLTNAMLEFGIEKIKGDTFQLSFRESEAVEITDESIIPLDYQRVKMEVDKTAIKKAIKNNEFVPGAELVKKQNLQIK